MELKFKVKSHVTVPLLKVPDNGTPVYVRITSEMFKAKDTEATRKAATNTDGTPKNQPPMLAHVVNIETGEVQQIICGTVLETELKDAYPNGSYVGKDFEIKKFKVASGKRYATYQIAEIELDGETLAAVNKAAPTAHVSNGNKPEAEKPAADKAASQKPGASNKATA